MRRASIVSDLPWEHSFTLAKTGLSEYMSRPRVAAEAGVRHVILYLKGTPDLGTLLSYNMANKSKLSEIHGRAVPEDLNTDPVEVLTDADWAGDKSVGAKRKHSVSSVMLMSTASWWLHGQGRNEA